MSKAAKPGLISIIIPTKNEERNIARCLASIKNNGYAKTETIVVDQKSSDNTVLIARKFKVKVISVVPSEIYQAPSPSRNIGFNASSGNIIVHLDADMELTPGLLDEIANKLEDKTVSALILPEVDVAANFWAKGKAFERSLYFGTPMEGARATRREIFVKVGYDLRIVSGEDWDITNRYRIHGNVVRTQNVVLHHLGKMSLVREFKKKYLYGKKSREFLSQNKPDMASLSVSLMGLYAKGITTNVIKRPMDVFSFVIIRLTDLLALTLGDLSTSLNKAISRF